MISNKDRALIYKALVDFLRAVDKSFIGDDMRPRFSLSLTFHASGYDDVEKRLSRMYDADMLRMRRDL